MELAKKRLITANVKLDSTKNWQITNSKHKKPARWVIIRSHYVMMKLAKCIKKPALMFFIDPDLLYGIRRLTWLKGIREQQQKKASHVELICALQFDNTKTPTT